MYIVSREKVVSSRPKLHYNVSSQFKWELFALFFLQKYQTREWRRWLVVVVSLGLRWVMLKNIGGRSFNPTKSFRFCRVFFSKKKLFLRVPLNCWREGIRSTEYSRRAGKTGWFAPQCFVWLSQIHYTRKKMRWNSVWRETVASHTCNRTDHWVFYDTCCSPLFHAKSCFISPPFLWSVHQRVTSSVCFADVFLETNFTVEIH